MIRTVEQLDKIRETLRSSKEICFDFETTSLHHKTMDIDGVAICADNMEPVFVWSPRFDVEYSTGELHSFMQEAFSQDTLYIGHNLQFDLKIMDYFYQTRPKRIFDTMIASWYLDENRPKGLKHLGETLLGIPMLSYSAHKKESALTLKNNCLEIAETMLRESNPDGKITKKAIKELAAQLEADTEVSVEWLEKYAKLDAEVTYKLYQLFSPMLTEDEHLSNLFYNLEMPFVYILVDMTLAGIDVDVPFLKEMEDHFSEEKTRLECEIYKELGEFNINSSQQISEKIYGITVKRVGGKIQLTDSREPGKTYAKPTEFTAGGAPSTSDAALEPIQTVAAELLREYRSVNKLLETYAVGYQRFVYDGILYPGFNHVGAVTGRLSSSEPNMQNLPASKTGDFFIRDAFTTRPGYKLVIADESQLELRLLAHFSEDPVLVEAFLSGKDIHRKTASDVLQIPLEEVSTEERYFFKTINFAIMYGMGAPKLAISLGISKPKADGLLKAYFQTYAGVPAFIKRTEQQMVNKGYIKTILGRRRRIPEVHSVSKKEMYRALRQTVNSKIQGSAADVLKAAMIKITDEFTEKRIDARILLQIHDELVCRVKDEHVEDACAIIKMHMERPFGKDLRVPLITEPKVCLNWGEGKD